MCNFGAQIYNLQTAYMLNRLISYFLHNRIISGFLLIILLLGGLATAPFDWGEGWGIPRDPVSVDAIPDVGDNQQIIATEWMGRSPKDMEDQVTYPLTTALLGIPGVKDIRSTSMMGMSFIYIIFEEDIEFYWSRSRILEKLNSLPTGLLPEGVQPTVGPDATALGQIYQYTLEGRDPKTGEPTPGWDPHELRTIQDYDVRYQLSAAEGVSEVASVGGFVKEYQVDLDPDAMRSYGISLEQAMLAVKHSNIDVGASTIEINKAEYLIRGLGYIKSLSDLEEAAVTSHNGVPVRVKDIAHVSFGPGERRGGLDKDGQEAVGGVVVARYGSNPMQVINNVKKQIEVLNAGMPEKQLEDGRTSKVTIVPFYDRTELIKQTIGTLESALTEEILICIIVVLILVLNIRASLVISAMLPLAVLLTFIIMRLVDIEANIVALSGIAIAIGVMVDVGVVFMENVVRKFEARGVRAGEVRGRELEALIEEGCTEVSSAILTAMATTIVSFLPIFAMQAQEGRMFHPLAFTKTFALLSALVLGYLMLPTLAYWVFSIRWPFKKIKFSIPNNWLIAIIVLLAGIVLSNHWLPLGPEKGTIINTLFVICIVALIISLLWLLVIYYEKLLRWVLAHRLLFMFIPLLTISLGVYIWRGLGQEFMPTLDEGSFMLMPTSMPHTGVEQNIEYSKLMDKRLMEIPEVESAVTKWGRVESALDPAPIQMFETVINYKNEYGTDSLGNRVRLWRKEIKSTDDIWKAIADAANLPGLTGSPKLQPIATRQVMLSTGLKAPMGLKVYGPDLESIDKAGLALEQIMREMPMVEPNSVYYDRVSGAPYLEIVPDREKLGRYGIQVSNLQEIIETAIGGMSEGNSVEGRQRFPIRVRYARELRNDPKVLSTILVNASDGTQIPLGQLADIRFVKGATMISSENTYLLCYITFDKVGNKAEVDVVNDVKQRLEAMINDGSLKLPEGVTYQFTGTYEQQSHAMQRLRIVIPVALMLILMILYFQFGTFTASLIHFSGVLMAFAGGFLMMGMTDFNLSVAVWVGFIALFGIATDDGVLMGTYIHQTFLRRNPQTREDIIEAVVEAGKKRVRPACMTTATTLIALLPVLTSTGKGSDIMIPMSIPTFGGMVIQEMTMFIVPVLQCWWRESKLKQ